MRERAVCFVLALFASLPVAGERLQFEGSFDARMICSKGEGCFDPVPIQPLTVSFTIDVDRVTLDSRSVSAQWTAPQFWPTLLTQSTFENLVNRRVESFELTNVSGTPSDWVWEYSVGSRWAGSSSNDDQAIRSTYEESRGLDIAGSRSTNGAVTFTDLVATFDAYLAGGTPIPISQRSDFQLVSSEGIGLSSESVTLTGSVRLTSITCRAPSSVGATLARAAKGLRGSS